MLQSIIDFLDVCQPFGYLLLLCSLTMVAAVFYHLLSRGNLRALRRLQALPLSGLASACSPSGGPLEAEVVFIREHRDAPGLEAEVESHLRLFMDSLRSGLSLISTMTNVAPMLGILGTARGLVTIFGVFGSEVAQQGIALGISQALYTTIFGLAIAVPGVIATACFERALEHRAALVEAFFAHLLANRNRL